MTTENHWMQLKHKYLDFQGRPRLDQVIWTIGTLVVPDYIDKVNRLRPDYHSMKVSIVYVTLLVEYSSDSPYVQIIFHGFIGFGIL